MRVEIGEFMRIRIGEFVRVRIGRHGEQSASWSQRMLQLLQDSPLASMLFSEGDSRIWYVKLVPWSAGFELTQTACG